MLSIKVSVLFLLVSFGGVAWACESYDNCMASSRFITSCSSEETCGGMIKHNKDMIPYIQRAIAYKLDEISKKLDEETYEEHLRAEAKRLVQV